MSDASIPSSQFVWTWRLELSDKTSLHPAREQAIATAAAVGITTGTLEGSFLVPRLLLQCLLKPPGGASAQRADSRATQATRPESQLTVFGNDYSLWAWLSCALLVVEHHLWTPLTGPTSVTTKTGFRNG